MEILSHVVSTCILLLQQFLHGSLLFERTCATFNVSSDASLSVCPFGFDQNRHFQISCPPCDVSTWDSPYKNNSAFQPGLSEIPAPDRSQDVMSQLKDCPFNSWMSAILHTGRC